MYTVKPVEHFGLPIHIKSPSVIKNCLGIDAPVFNMMFVGTNQQLNQLITKLMSYADEPVDVSDFVDMSTYGLFCDYHRRKLVLVDMDSFSVLQEKDWARWWNLYNRMKEQNHYPNLCEEDADALEVSLQLADKALADAQEDPFPFSMFKRSILKQMNPEGKTWGQMIGNGTDLVVLRDATLAIADWNAAKHLFGINTLLKEL